MIDRHLNQRRAARRAAASQGAAVAVAGAAGWLVLTEGDPASLLVGAPAVALAVIVSLRAQAPPPTRPGALALFAPFFIGEVFASAWFVARRALLPDPGFDPGVVVYPVRLRSVAARAAFMNSVTLTPGTLAADLRGDALAVHVLDRRVEVSAPLAALEIRIAELFDEPLEERR